MTVINNAVRAKIEVEGVNSHQQRIPATITSTFVVDEIVSGIDSTAFAKVAVEANPGDTYIVIKQRTRYFYFEEELVGSISGAGESNGSMTTGSELYTNPLYGIEDGLWTLETTGNMIASIDDSVMKINIDQGGNLATGYQFGFSLANFGLVDDIEGDGLFLKHLPTRYYIDFGVGYVQVWAGIIDTFPKSGDTTAQFKCTDIGKANVEKIGSDLIPIALNRNYNCKLVLEGDKDANFDYIQMFSDENSGYISVITEDKNGSAIRVAQSQAIQDLIDADEFKNIIVEVVFGAGVGNTYNVVKAENNNPSHELFLDEEDISELEVSNDVRNFGTSLIVLKRFNFTYNLSKNPVNKVHTDNDSNTSLPVRIKESGVNKFISPESYEVINGVQLEIKDIVDEDSMLFKEKLNDLSYIGHIVANNTIEASSGTGGQINLKADYYGSGLEKFASLQNNNDRIFYRPESILIENAIYSDEPPATIDPTTFKLEDTIKLMNVVHTFSKKMGGRTVSSAFKIYGYYANLPGFDSERIEVSVTVGSLLNHYNVEITSPYWNSFKSAFEIEERVTDAIGVDSLLHEFNISLNELPSTGGGGGPLTYWSDEVKDSLNYTVKYSYEGEKAASIDAVVIGCNGENVQAGNEFENYPDTFQYIQENEIKIPLANIDTASYAQAQEDYDLFPSVTERNPSHQIISQTDSNTVLKDMLKSSHLAMYPDRLGKYNLENWLPKSTVFSDSPTVASYTDQNWLPKGISKISRSEITQVVSDFQLNYDFNESNGEFQRSGGESNNPMRIKRTDLEVFDFDLCTEGVSVENTEIAEQAWELFRAGYLRAKKLTQTTLETKWIKMLFSDGTGESEAINFIRNHAGHVNRELEKVTITLPLNSTDAIVNLLSFISVTDQKRTNGETRQGWIIDHKISWKSKEIIFKILLDISQFDPFLVQLNIIQDNANVTDIIQQDANATSIIQNGTGK